MTMRAYASLFTVAYFLCCPHLIFGNPRISAQLLITAPPSPEATACLNANALKREESCQYGYCGGTCLDQGAFCCGPAGTLATSPYWLCDNGACITSVRGTTGVVDCYDPDNPSGTTQSCIDYVPTATCKPTDRCYTCESTVPFCRWETYIASNQPTLSWFSCDTSKLADATFFAATITADLPSSSDPSATSNGNKDGTQNGGSSLSTGAIVGISVGGGLVIIGIVAVVGFCCLKRKPKSSFSSKDHHDNPMQPPMTQQIPQELDAQNSTNYERSELNSATAYSPQTQPGTPFTPPEEYARNVEELHMWAGAHEQMRSDMQAQKPGYFVRPPQELHDDTVDQRGSWGYGDDQTHTRPTDRY